MLSRLLCINKDNGFCLLFEQTHFSQRKREDVRILAIINTSLLVKNTPVSGTAVLQLKNYYINNYLGQLSWQRKPLRKTTWQILWQIKPLNKMILFLINMLIADMLNNQNNYLDVFSLWFGTESLSEGETQLVFFLL